MPAVLQKIPRSALVLVGLVLFGLIRYPIEERAEEKLVASRMLLPPPGQTAIDQMSQSALMGTLGGLRALVATYLTLEGYEHFSVKDWESLAQTYNIITSLEPSDEEHWVSAVWHLGINATANMEIDETLPKFERDRRFKEYAFQAIDFAERGMEQNPESWRIPVQLGEVYREKLKDNCATARTYKKVMEIEGSPGYARRFHGYFLARCPGNEEEAYRYLMSLYREGEHQHLPTLIKEIKVLEEKLGVPYPERIPDRDPDRRPRKRNQPPSNVLPGGIVIP